MRSWGLRGRKGDDQQGEHEMRAQVAAWAVTEHSAVKVTHVRKRHGIDTHRLLNVGESGFVPD
jgi:hypothetical protein